MAARNGHDASYSGCGQMSADQFLNIRSDDEWVVLRDSIQGIQITVRTSMQDLLNRGVEHVGTLEQLGPVVSEPFAAPSGWRDPWFARIGGGSWSVSFRLPDFLLETPSSGWVGADEAIRRCSPDWIEQQSARRHALQRLSFEAYEKILARIARMRRVSTTISWFSASSQSADNAQPLYTGRDLVKAVEVALATEGGAHLISGLFEDGYVPAWL